MYVIGLCALHYKLQSRVYTLAIEFGNAWVSPPLPTMYVHVDDFYVICGVRGVAKLLTMDDYKL